MLMISIVVLGNGIKFLMISIVPLLMLSIVVQCNGITLLMISILV